MHLTIRQLKIFQAVADNDSFTRAAEVLHLSQPAVSMQVKQLEEKVGQSLFEQVGKRVYLTAAGQELLGYSRRIISLLDEAAQVLDEMKGKQRGRLSIAVASTANYFAPLLLATFNQRFPNIKVILDVTNREGLLKHLNRNDTDIVIMGKPPDNMDVDAHRFMDNPLDVIASGKDELAHKKNIRLGELQNRDFLIREKGSGTRIAMEKCFADKRLNLSIGMEMNTNEAIKQAVQAGLGLGIVSRHTIAMELETNRLVILDVESFPIMRHWYIVHPAGKRLSAIADAFKAFVLKEAEDLFNVNSL